MVELKKRCVRIVYKDEFYLDILPACRDRGNSGTCIQVPDRDLRNWTPSNPITYAIWFENATYRLRSRPVIAVLNPTLALAKGKCKLPQTYSDGQLDICVHEPDEWNSRLLVADTIMPWVSQWLRFYEYWEQTGRWEGKGSHPEFRSHQGSPLT